MVVGIPNVGKSSLINTWRSHNMGTKQSAVIEGDEVSSMRSDPRERYGKIRVDTTGDYSYISHLGIKGGPTDNLEKLLLRVCSEKDFRKRCLIGLTYEDRWDFDRAITMFIQLFRKGVIRDCCLDKEMLRPFM
ncbi:hypothetical protein COOONC_17699 [Cooperia oncophora]